MITFCFAEVAFRLCLEVCGKRRPLREKVQHYYATRGSELASMLPTWCYFWASLVEFLLHSAAAVKACSALKQIMHTMGEWKSLSVDGTYKVCVGLIGQAKFNMA